MQTVEQVQTAWAALDRQTQIKLWDDFTRDLDEGMAGWHPYYLVLMPMYERGEQPYNFASDYDFHIDEDYVVDVDLSALPKPVDLAAELAKCLAF